MSHDRAHDALVHAKAEKREYVVLGTLGTNTWRYGLSGRVAVLELVDRMADLKETLIKPGFPIWSWYSPPKNRRRVLISLGADARNPATKGDTLWVTKNPSRFSSPSTAF